MMAIGGTDRIAMNQRQRDTLTVLKSVLLGETSQADAAVHLGKSARQDRRLVKALGEHGDRAVVHGLTGKPSNHKAHDDFKKAVLDAYARYYPDFGPTFAAEKLAADRELV